MMMLTQDLIGEPLNYATGKAAGFEVFVHPDFPYVGYEKGRYSPTTDWNQAGELLAMEKLDLMHFDDGTVSAMSFRKKVHSVNGPTELVAICRCVVALKLGDQIDIPEELLK